MKIKNLKVIWKPQHRYEAEICGISTIIEGKELETLLRRHAWYWKRLRKKEGEVAAFSLAVVKAFQSLYGYKVITQEELRDLSSPDARKMELFDSGLIYAINYAYNKVNKKRSSKKGMLKKLYDASILEFKLPFGFRIDLKKLFDNND